MFVHVGEMQGKLCPPLTDTAYDTHASRLLCLVAWTLSCCLDSGLLLGLCLVAWALSCCLDSVWWPGLRLVACIRLDLHVVADLFPNIFSIVRLFFFYCSRISTSRSKHSCISYLLVLLYLHSAMLNVCHRALPPPPGQSKTCVKHKKSKDNFCVECMQASTHAPPCTLHTGPY